MASYRPYSRNGSGQPWRQPHPYLARRKRNGIEYVIGWFDTREEAEEAERGFDSVWPSRRGQHYDYAFEGV